MSQRPNLDCRTCVHFRSAPYETKFEGCYLEKNMVSKQKQLCLDEQQLPGDHRQINRLGDCSDHVARAAKASFWKSLWSLGA